MLRKYISIFVLTIAIAAAVSSLAIADDSPGYVAAQAQLSPAPSARTPSPTPAKAAARTSQPSTTAKPGATGHAQAQLPRMVIVVTATRMATPLSEIGTAVSVVSNKLIQSQQIRDVTPALREVPGVELTACRKQ